MGILDRLWPRRPAPEPETPAEREQREVMAAVRLLQARGFEPAGPARTDALASLTMGMGIDTLDKRQTITPTLRPFFALDQLDALFMQAGPFRRISCAPAVDAVSPGWRTNTAKIQDATSAFDRQWQLRRRLTHAIQLARGYGRSHILILTNDGAPLSEPLGPGPHEIRGMQLLMRRECIPFRWSSDITSDGFGDVDLWNVVPIRVGVFAPSTPVHASRIVTIRGMDAPLTPVSGFDLGRGLSVPDVYWEELRDIVAVWASLATGALEMSTPVLTLGAHLDAVAGGDRTDYAAALQLLKMSRSMWGMTVKAGSDELTRDNVSFTGIKEVITALQERVCMVEGLSATRIFGQSPGGLSTDDASGRATYQTFISGVREERAEPALQTVCGIARGPADRSIAWGPLEVASPREQAEIDLIHAQRDAVLITAKVIAPAEARARYEGDETLPMPVVVGEYEADEDTEEAEPDAEPE